ncbi:MAG: cytochrome P460 family protein [Alphaproteobacteria bacterium]
MTGLLARDRSATATLAVLLGLVSTIVVQAASICPEEQPSDQVPTDLALCRQLLHDVQNPSGMALNDYEAVLGKYLEAMCHRDLEGGWTVDKRVRDTGPWIGIYQNGKWTGQYNGTHAPVLVWYSPGMYAWLKANRRDDPPASDRPPGPAAELPPATPVPDGAIIVKEMYTPPAAACTAIDPLRLKATAKGAAIMVRDSKGAHDGWFWSGYGWGPPDPDWPAPAGNRYPYMGFGQYCTNCHASAKDNQTFASLRNIMGEPGEPLVFLSQNFFLDPSWQTLRERIAQAGAKDAAAAGNDPKYNDAFTHIFESLGGEPKRADFDSMQSETYDHVWAKPGPVTATDQFLTSDQCLGCHSAGGTGIQFDMTEPGNDNKLVNISPYGTWRGSPMGLAGRDPIFFAQLASETGTFYKDSKPMVENICLGCHGVQGQRQYGIDTAANDGVCEPFARSTVDAAPYPPSDPVAALARYGALARDGVSCMACHRMALDAATIAKVRGEPQNACVEERQKLLNRGLIGFAATFTGSYFVGPPNDVYGPFTEPKKKSMKNAIGMDPVHNNAVTSSELCGSCHTVHLPVMRDNETLDHVYEQTTYPEWAFSDFRTGDSPDGPLPSLSGPRAQSCQACHMPNKDASGNPYRSKIASIQERSNFPEAEHVLKADDIDLKVRAGFAKHTLVGLNVFLLKMAFQFPDVLGIRTRDPMLDEIGIDSIPTAEGAMLDQAVNRTASVTVADVRKTDDEISARVTVINKVGHKFPSGVGFRRAFIEFSVLDDAGKPIWSSGATDGAGVILGADKQPLASELWWGKTCKQRIDPEKRLHQPHYEEITSQDQAQIYEELTAAPPETGVATCGYGATPAGPLTTSFLSICAKVKDNRLLPAGFLPLEQRIEIAEKLGAHSNLAKETGPWAVGNDPDYRSGGSDSLTYRIRLSELGDKKEKAASVQATLYYQPTPPYYLQDRFCTSESSDTKRLYYLAGKLGLAGTQAQDWKLRVVTSGPVALP